MKAKNENYQVEITDTIGGEANYSWVRRFSFTAPEGASARTIKARARKAADMQGVRGRWSNIGDMMEFRPRGACIVAFVEWRDDSAAA